MDRVEDAEDDSRMSFITRSAKNLSASVDMAEDTQVGEVDGGDNKIVKKSPLFKKPKVPTRYFTFLCFEKRWVSPDSF